MTDDTRPTTPLDPVLDGTWEPGTSGADSRAETPVTELIPPAAPLPRPRVRWGAIIWGLVLAGIAAGTLWIVLDPALRDDVSEWWFALTPAGMLLAALVAVGGLLLIAGIAGLARRASRSR
ncbi:hypothetical protein [Agromyces larvae]|uniref:DUF1049 domain-containing protein n=1 Tax=Agromyces larvae TaxID=2929802 RepID=A0ABY4C1N3_9MICO|nr:hypothetical protein [Agromyces larvae]UOE43886.1 hypothetical protein MTO99_17230 [Agromyces larvae]